MRMRNPKDKELVLKNCDFYYTEFDNNNPIHLEIGMGKGKFILEMALKYPNINFIGVEKYSSVASVAIKKINEYKPNNLKILITDAIKLEEILSKKIDTIYLNFSDPWPKDRHAKRRLTSPIFLEKYDKVFRNDNIIEMKTDNIDLFNYSVDSLKEYGYNIEYITNDLHKENVDNIMTEYEERFSKLNIKINKLIVRK